MQVSSGELYIHYVTVALWHNFVMASSYRILRSIVWCGALNSLLKVLSNYSKDVQVHHQTRNPRIPQYEVIRV